MRELRLLVEGKLAKVPIEALEVAATRYRGNVLEGLEFSNFHDFHSAHRRCEPPPCLHPDTRDIAERLTSKNKRATRTVAL